MESNGTSLQSLAERIRAKTEQDALEIESLTRQQFESLSRSLSASSKTALSTTENAIHSSIAELERNITSRFLSLGDMFNRKYLLSIVLSGGIVLASVCICGGLIALSRQQITDLRREVAELSARRTELENTIADWPMTVRNAPNGRFIVPKPPHTLKDKWTFDGQSAWKLE